MNTKTSKFMLCENPILDEDHDQRSFILHNRDPFILAEVFYFEDASEDEVGQFIGQFKMGSKLNYPPETYVFGALWMVPGDGFLKMTPQQQASTCAGIMRRMADWYKAYLIWEDKGV